MTFDFSDLSSTDFAFGLFGACLVEFYRLKRLLDKNKGKLRASRLQLLLNTVCFLFFIFGSGVLAATQGVSPEFSALYAGLTFPVFLSVILRDNAEAEKELVQETVNEKDSEILELKKHMRMVLEQFGSSMEPELARKIATSVREKEITSVGYVPSFPIGTPPTGGAFSSRNSQRPNEPTYWEQSENTKKHSRYKLISIRNLLIDSFLVLAVLGLLLYFQATWLIILSPVLLCVSLLIRHHRYYRWLQRFLNGFF